EIKLAPKEPESEKKEVMKNESNGNKVRDKEREAELENARRQLMEMQENRLGLMYQQKQMMQMLHEQDIMEWKKRETRYQLMEKRVESIFQTSTELQNYVSTIVKLQKNCEDGLHQQVNSFATTETGYF
ncbi:hypothetical protein RFI_33649, partial [Reticulomyxa filosa]